MPDQSPFRPTAPAPATGPRAEGGIAATGRGLRTLLTLVGIAVFSGLLGLALVYVPAVFLFGALAGAAGVVVILARPYLGLLLYTVVYLLRPGELNPILAPLHLERIVGAITLLSLAFDMYRREGMIFLDASRQTKWLFAFLAGVLLSIPSSYWVGWSADRLVEMLKIVAFYIMVVQLIGTRKRMQIFIWTYGLLVAYIAFSAVKAYYSGSYVFAQGIDRAVGQTSAGGDPNNLGTTLASTVPLYLLLARYERSGWRKLVLGGCLMLSVWTIFLTGSRASLLGLVSAVGFLIWTSRYRVRWMMLAVVAITVAVAVLPNQYKKRYSTIFKATEGQIDGSSQGRLDAWKVGLEMIADRPLFGVGAGCFGTAHAMAYSPPGQRNWLEAHSLYVQTFAELGLVGGIAFFGFLGQILKLNRKVARLVAIRGPTWAYESALLQAVFGGLLVLIVSGIFGHSLFRSTWYMFGAIGLAIYRLHLDRPASPPAEA